MARKVDSDLPLARRFAEMRRLWRAGEDQVTRRPARIGKPSPQVYSPVNQQATGLERDVLRLDLVAFD
jgi:hypothetical protein